MNRQLESKWIPYPERLPRKQDEYLVSWKIQNESKSFLTIAEYEIDYDNWILDDYIQHYHNVEVTAWMPLPKPYEA